LDIVESNIDDFKNGSTNLLKFGRTQHLLLNELNWTNSIRTFSQKLSSQYKFMNIYLDRVRFKNNLTILPLIEQAVSLPWRRVRSCKPLREDFSKKFVFFYENLFKPPSLYRAL
jgi:hypothetical protein